MYNMVLAIGMVAACVTSGVAGPFRRSQVQHNGPVRTVMASVFTSAQSVANHMAHIGRIGHFGGNSGYEGVGMGSTARAAEMNCCYRNRMTPIEVGIAQGSNGMFYACCRY